MTSRGSSSPAVRGSAVATLAVSSADIATAADAVYVCLEVFTGIKLTEANALWEEFASYLFPIDPYSPSLQAPLPHRHLPKTAEAGRLFMRIARCPYVVRKCRPLRRLEVKGMTSFQ